MKKITPVLLAVLLVCCLSGKTRAETGVSGAQILQQQNSARAAAMGDAFAAVSGDLTSVNINPAGIHDLQKMEIMLMHVAGFEGLSTEYLVGAVPLPDFGVLGVQMIYRTLPTIDNKVADEPTVNVKDMVYGLAWGRSLFAGFSVGINAKYVSLELGPATASALSFDLGTQYQATEALGFGLAVRNAGTPVMFLSAEDPLPLTVLAGASYLVLNTDAHQILTDLDLDYLIPDKNTTLHIGGEYWFRRILALRLGYQYSQQRSVRGLSAGVGFRFKAGEKVDILLDYTMQPQSWDDQDFETENLITLSVRF